MAVIQRLSPQLAQKIAAGEVVTRPESVVKELLENSLDAKAQSVTVVLKDAGKTLIQIIDDGLGMSREDARLSIERHATSKLASIDDLEKLRTFGFRGEALAAISSVSQFELRTRRRDDELGTLLEVEGGILRKCESTACDEGTSISIRNIFFNVPARRKFMKSEATEFKHIVDAVTKAALAHPEVRFILISDADCIFDLPAFRPLPERIEQIFGGRLRNALIPVEHVSPLVHIHGFVSAPSFVKRVRTEQFFFVNNRPVTSKGLSYAVASAYEHLIEKGAFPSSFLFVDIDPSRIDINVHPQKLEVKFDDERSVIDELRHSLQDALQKATQLTLNTGALSPEMTLPEQINSNSDVARMRFPEHANASALQHDVPNAGVSRFAVDMPSMASPRTSNPPPRQSDGSGKVPTLNTLERLFGAKAPDLFRGNEADVPTVLPTKPMPAVMRQEPDKPASLATEVLKDKPILWQLHNKYIFSQIKSGLMIVDQHVAHERILYERVLRSLEENSPYSQQLLFPQAIDLLPREMAIIREVFPDLERMGFQLRFFGGQTIVVEGIPADVRSGREDSILREVIEAYEEFGETKILSGRDALAASFACRAAIKSGDKLSQEEMHVLIEQLFQTKMPYVCPHGRPIVIKLAIDELDRRFGRSPVENMQRDLQ
jgi:DNA mismatch repair protein MutL